MKRAMVRVNDGYCIVLCHLGHLVDLRKLDETWGGSMFEAEVGDRQAGQPNRFDRMAEACQGFGHTKGGIQ